MTVRSRRLVGPVGAAAATVTTVYTVPGGRTAVVHTIRLVNNGGNNDTVNLYLNGTLIAQYVLNAIAGQRQVADSAGLVMNPGDTFGIYSQLGTSFVTLTGALLLGAPS